MFSRTKLERYRQLAKEAKEGKVPDSFRFIQLKPGKTKGWEKYKYKGGQPSVISASLLYLLYKHKDDCIAIPDTMLTGGKFQQNMSSFNWFISDKADIEAFIASPGVWEKIKKCVDAKKRFIIIPMSVHGRSTPAEIRRGEEPAFSHAVYLIYTRDTKVVEIHDPHGVNAYPQLTLDPGAVQHLFNAKIPGMVKKVLPAVHTSKDGVGLQFLHDHEGLSRGVGYCIPWATLYADMRMSNPTEDPKTIILSIASAIKQSHSSYHKFIHNYSLFVQMLGKEMKKKKDPRATIVKLIKAYTV